MHKLREADALIGQGLAVPEVIISPLQSLMKDQVDGVESKLGARLAEAVSGMLSPVERQVTFERVARGETAMLYLSPEQLRNPSVKNLLQTRTIGCWVYDEAHCVSKWGHDFRPDYLAVARFIREISCSSIPQVCALTATAKADVVAEILGHFQEELGLSLTVHNGGTERDNLTYEVRLVEEKAKHAEIAELIRAHLSGHGAAIVFAATRQRTQDVAQYLTALGIPAEAYHAGLDHDAKKHLQNRYLRNEVRVICATNAFGMGVDKPDIRLVIHLDAPGSLENYLQEAGRAGRDREQALCVLLYTEDDLERQFRMSAYSELTRRDINSVLRALRQAARRLKLESRQEFHITVGEILQQDDRLEEDGADTKVKTAVAWLERKGFLQRNLNHNRVLLPDLGWTMPASDRAKQEEERRLFYVGCTRARDELVVLAAPDHSLAPELRGEHVVFEPAPLPPKNFPASIDRVRYTVLELSDINLGHPGIYSASHPIHRDLAQTQAGDVVELCDINGKVVIHARGQKIGQLSSKARDHWLPRMAQIERVTVVAFVVRFADQGNGSGGAPPQVAQWEVPILEIKTVPPGGPLN